ncbi:MAG: hypothetical protein RQ839_09025, partial [Thermoproteus sp.]|nr:hypothetical protein [Thermoproteus sp.]
VAAGRVYAKGGSRRIVGVIEEGELPVTWEGHEIVYVNDENKFILQKIIYDEVNEKIEQITIATYDANDECAKASFDALFNEPRFSDFKALWTYLFARAQEEAKQ